MNEHLSKTGRSIIIFNYNLSLFSHRWSQWSLLVYSFSYLVDSKGFPFQDLRLQNQTQMSKQLLAMLLLMFAAFYYGFYLSPQMSTLQVQFQKFKSEYGKNYRSLVQQKYRQIIFIHNLARIEKQNTDPRYTYKIGVTKFADLTSEQFERTYLLLTRSPQTAQIRGFNQFNTLKSAGTQVDWTMSGKVSRVKDQGNCGSCWAFSAVGAIQSAYLIKGQQKILSQQQLVDCAGPYGNHGCGGGWMNSAFAYVKDKGLISDKQYPYVAKNQPCRAPEGGQTFISYYRDNPGCQDLLNGLSNQPISVAVDAGSWSLYRGGILNICGSTINHGVLLVGANDGYWKVKNSWGSSWGESGFIRLARGNTCSICAYPSYPIL